MQSFEVSLCVMSVEVSLDGKSFGVMSSFEVSFGVMLSVEVSFGVMLSVEVSFGVM